MKVTILVPVYKVEKYIAECAASLFEQTYADIEYVFCDDCTPDNSVAVLRNVMEEYPSRRNAVRIIRMPHNSGIGQVRARLIEEVHTDAFFFTDSDDRLPLSAIATLVRIMQDTDVDIVDGAHVDMVKGEIKPAQLTYHGSDATFMKRILCQNVEANRVWGRLYNARVLKALPDMFFDGIDYSEDYCAVARLAALTTRAWTDEVVYIYRKDNPSSYTKNVSEKNMLSYLRANGKVLQFYKRRGRLPLALEVGMLNTYRECRRSHIALTVADGLVDYQPERMVTKLIYRLLRSKAGYAVGDRLYRLLRAVAKK